MARFVRRSIGRSIDEIEGSRAARSASLVIPDNPSQTLGRDDTDITTGLSPVRSEDVFGLDLYRPVSRVNAAVRSTLSEVEDGRTFSPDPDQRLRRISGSRPVRLASAPPSRVGGLLDTYPVVRSPEHAIVCVRRKIRRGVILAKGKGGGGHRKGRKGRNSNIWC